jgi:hypothetical protein
MNIAQMVFLIISVLLVIVSVVYRSSIAVRITCVIVLLLIGLTPVGMLPRSASRNTLNQVQGKPSVDFMNGVTMMRESIEQPLFVIVLPMILAFAILAMVPVRRIKKNNES